MSLRERVLTLSQAIANWMVCGFIAGGPLFASCLHVSITSVSNEPDFSSILAVVLEDRAISFDGDSEVYRPKYNTSVLSEFRSRKLLVIQAVIY